MLHVPEFLNSFYLRESFPENRNPRSIDGLKLEETFGVIRRPAHQPHHLSMCTHNIIFSTRRMHVVLLSRKSEHFQSSNNLGMNVSKDNHVWSWNTRIRPTIYNYQRMTTLFLPTCSKNLRCANSQRCLLPPPRPAETTR